MDGSRSTYGDLTRCSVMCVCIFVSTRSGAVLLHLTTTFAAVTAVTAAATARRSGLGRLHACACYRHVARCEDVHGIHLLPCDRQHTRAVSSQL